VLTDDPTLQGKIERVSSSQLDTSRHTCTVRYQLRTFAAERQVNEPEEEHTVRYFFPLELNLFLEITGFKPVRLGAFPEFDCDPLMSRPGMCCARRVRCSLKRNSPVGLYRPSRLKEKVRPCASQGVSPEERRHRNEQLQRRLLCSVRRSSLFERSFQDLNLLIEPRYRHLAFALEGCLSHMNKPPNEVAGYIDCAGY
jgi:hypothetical protein